MTFTETISINTKGFCDIVNITSQVHSIVNRPLVSNGLVTLFCPGSTGTTTTIEYESGVLQDLKDALEKIAPPYCCAGNHSQKAYLARR